MPTTPTHGLPFPTSADPNNVPADLQALAEAVDGLHPTIIAGEQNGASFTNRTFAPNASFLHPIAFTRTYSTPPQVTPDFLDTTATGLTIEARDVTTSGANLEVNNTRPTEQAGVDYSIKWHTTCATTEVS